MTLGIDVMERLLALGKRPSLSSGFLDRLVVDDEDFFGGFVLDLGTEPEVLVVLVVVPGQ